VCEWGEGSIVVERGSCGEFLGPWFVASGSVINNGEEAREGRVLWLRGLLVALLPRQLRVMAHESWDPVPSGDGTLVTGVVWRGWGWVGVAWGGLGSFGVVWGWT
jgi:hypothetical protein